MTSQPSSPSPPAVGLRERKKAKTREAIRRHAFRLFDEQGYAATTVDQIAEAAEVSPSTFFRYFPTKEDVALVDDYDPLMLAELRAQPAGTPPIEAIRTAIRSVFGRVDEAWELEQQRQRLVMSVPELRARSLDQLGQVIGVLGTVVAERAGLAPDSFPARVLAGAAIGVAMAALLPSVSGSVEASDMVRIDEALGLLAAGLPLLESEARAE